jgi:hypothetical protein
MKLNFWQVIGVILLIVGAIGYAFFKDKKRPPNPAPEFSHEPAVEVPATSSAAPATQSATP